MMASMLGRERGWFASLFLVIGWICTMKPVLSCGLKSFYFGEEVWCKGFVDEGLTAFATKIKRLQSFSKTL